MGFEPIDPMSYSVRFEQTRQIWGEKLLEALQARKPNHVPTKVLDTTLAYNPPSKTNAEIYFPYITPELLRNFPVRDRGLIKKASQKEFPAANRIYGIFKAPICFCGKFLDHFSI